MTDHFLTRAKAYAVLVGLLVTLVVGEIDVSTRLHQWLVLLGGLATIVATYQIPNKDPRGTHQDESVMPPEAGQGEAFWFLGMAVIILLILWLAGAFHR